MNNKCLICCGPVDAEDYHPRCAFKFFERRQIPELPYSEDKINELEKQIIKSRSTITGVQKKISLDIEKGSGGKRLTIVGLWGRFILKPPNQNYPEMPAIEHVSMRIANELKIAVVPHALIKMPNGELAYISRRVDRLRDGSRLHMEDMCQLTGRLTEDKYKSSMENVAKAINEFSSNPMLDAINFFEVAVFSFLIGNADMHLKNFSLLWKDTEHIVLAPAYDLLSTRLMISEKNDPEEMALTLNGKKNKILRNDILSFGASIGLSKKQIENVMLRFLVAIGSIDPLVHSSFLSDESQDKFSTLIHERAKRLEQA